VDYTSQQALAAKCLERIARHLGDRKSTKRFQHEFQLISRQVNHWMWCPKSGFYHDVFLDGNWMTVKTSAGFWPLLAGIPDPEQAALLIGHLLNPSEFWRYHPIPTLSADDPNYDSTGKYWLGGVWAPTNTAVIKGISQYGYDNVAHLIAQRHLDRMAEIEQAVRPHTLWECYAPDRPLPGTMKEGRHFSRPDFVGWSALGATTLFYENVLGIRSNAPKRRITWDVRLTERHGFRKYPFLNQWVTLLAERRQLPSSLLQITVRSSVAFELVVHVINRVRKILVLSNQAQQLNV